MTDFVDDDASPIHSIRHLEQNKLYLRMEFLHRAYFISLWTITQRAMITLNSTVLCTLFCGNNYAPDDKVFSLECIYTCFSLHISQLFFIVYKISKLDCVYMFILGLI